MNDKENKPVKMGGIAPEVKLEGEGPRVVLRTKMQLDDLDDLVPTLPNLERFGFKCGDEVRVTIIKVR